MVSRIILLNTKADVHRRVCVITTLRIAISAQLDINDFTYDLIRIAIVTDLEPLLGIIIACLPLFPPVFQKLSKARNGDGTASRKALSSSVLRLRSGSTKTWKFRKFDGSYILTDVERGAIDNRISSPDSKPNSMHDDDLRQLVTADTNTQSKIRVNQGWDVRTEPAGQLP